MYYDLLIIGGLLLVAGASFLAGAWTQARGARIYWSKVFEKYHDFRLEERPLRANAHLRESLREFLGMKESEE